MNAKIVGLLRISDNPVDLYAAQYIEELQKKNEILGKRLCEWCAVCSTNADANNCEIAGTDTIEECLDCKYLEDSNCVHSNGDNCRNSSLWWPKEAVMDNDGT